MANETYPLTTTQAIAAMPQSQTWQTLGNGSIFTFAGFLISQGIDSKVWMLWIGAAVITFLLPLFIALRQRAILWLTKAGAEKVDGQAGDTTPRSTIGAVLLVITLAVAVAGCSSDPTRQLAEIDQTYTATVDALDAAIDGGLITDARTLEVLRATVIEVNAVRAKAHAATQPADKEFWLGEARGAVAKFVRIYAKYQAEKDAQAK